MSDLLKRLRKTNKHIQSFLAGDERPAFISTSCYALNILFSGRLNGGIPRGRISTIAAPSSLGKSFTALKVARNAQKEYGMDVIYVDTEFAYDPNFASSIGIDHEKFLPIQTNKIENVQQAITSSLADITKEEKENIMIVLDSWGGLVTSKTMQDAIDGKDVVDMTIAKKKNSLARVLSGLGVTVFVVNHVYSGISAYEPDTIGGGKGIIFASSCIVQGTSKAKDKGNDGDIAGAIITAKNYKGRFAKEHSKLKFLIQYEGGIHKYYGLLDDALESGMVVKPSMGWYTRPSIQDDKKWREKEIWDNSKEFWTPIIESSDFQFFIEKKYSFDHNIIYKEDDDSNGDSNNDEGETTDHE